MQALFLPLAVTFTVVFSFYKFGRGTLGQFVHSSIKPENNFCKIIIIIIIYFYFYFFYFPNIHGNGTFPDIHGNIEVCFLIKD